MTVTSTTQKSSFSGDGSTTAFATSFFFVADADLRVILVNSAGTETVQTITTHYTVTGAGAAAGGTVTMVTAPASGETLIIKRVEALTQPSDLPAAGVFPAATVEEMADRNLTLAQQQQEELDRAPKFKESTTSTTPTFPEPSADKVVGWNSGGTDLENKTPNTSAYLSSPIGVADGGTGASSLTDGGILLGSGTSAITAMAVLADGEMIVGDGTADPVAESGATLRTSIGLGTFAVENIAAVPAQTLAGAITGADQTVSAVNLKDYGEATNAIGSTGGGTQDIDLTLGNVVTATVDTSANTFTFSNPTTSDEGCSFTLVLVNGGSQTVNWPASVDWEGGTAPALTTSGTDILTFLTVDGGTIWHGFVASLDSK